MKRYCLVVMFLIMAQSASATEYLGLNLGVATKDAVAQKLKSENASFQDNLGYRGYTNLPMFRVSSYEKFSKLGTVKDALLTFTSKGLLYSIYITYSGAGENAKVIKDALDAKYGVTANKGSGFTESYIYVNGETGISLKIDTFDKITTLIYFWTPFYAEFLEAKDLVDADIKKKNAQKVGSDL